MYSMIFTRSFSRYQQKKLGCAAFLVCLLIALSFCTLFKSYYFGPLPVLNLQLPMVADLNMLSIKDTSSSHLKVNLQLSTGADSSEMLMVKNISISQQLENENKDIKPICYVLEPRSDFCEMNGNIRIRGNSSSIFIASSQRDIMAGKISWTIRPYARKGSRAMEHVRNWSINSVTDHKEIPQCTLNHSVPAILFSVGGFSGNHFHDFSDLVIPLYLTSIQFNGEVQFLVTDNRPWWISKFRGILEKLSRYEIIDIDREEECHCYPSAIVGLTSISVKELSIDPLNSPNGLSMNNFRKFLRGTYSLKRAAAIKIGHENKRPRLMIIFRKKTRSFMNEGEIIKMARSLGYDVVAAEANLSSNLSRFARIVNSCDVLMGVHGAGLTNMVFLPANAVLIQIIPLGGIEGLARNDFGKPAIDMDIKYLEYEISIKESSLTQQYPLDHAVLNDPLSVRKQGWNVLSSTYLDKQNVKLDVQRFRTTLTKAFELLH